MKNYLGPNEIPLVEEVNYESQWNNAIRKYGVLNAHVWFGIEDLKEIEMTKNVLLQRSGIITDEGACE